MCKKCKTKKGDGEKNTSPICLLRTSDVEHWPGMSRVVFKRPESAKVHFAYFGLALGQKTSAPKNPRDARDPWPVTPPGKRMAKWTTMRK